MTVVDPHLISVVSACTALVASVAGPLVTLTGAMRQFNATVLSANRQKWIESLRETLAELITVMVAASVVKQRWKERWNQGFGPLEETRRCCKTRATHPGAVTHVAADQSDRSSAPEAVRSD
jgi:hypothetical protein